MSEASKEIVNMRNFLSLLLLAGFLSGCATAPQTEPIKTPETQATETLNLAVAGGGNFEKYDKESIRRVIRDNRKKIQRCYDNALRINTEIKGKLTIEWDIEVLGQVSNASVKTNNTGSEELGICIANQIKKMKFDSPPPNDQIARVVFPFVFAPDAKK